MKAGANPLTLDAHGRTADQHWKLRGKCSDDNRHFDPAALNACLAVLARAVQSLSASDALKISQRQDFHTFTTGDTAAFEAWLSRQPPDLTVGEPRWLPNQALAQTHTSAAEAAKRAGLLLRHQSPQALERVGSDGLVEREALWWAVAGGALKGPFPHLKRAWKDSMATDAWLDLGLLDAGEVLVRRVWLGDDSPKPPLCVAQAALMLAAKAVASLANVTLSVEPNLDRMTPTSPHRWDEPDQTGATPLERCLRLASEGLGSWVSLDDHADVLFALEEWTRAQPLNPFGEPRHALANACLALFAFGTSSGNLNVTKASEVGEAIQEGFFYGLSGNACRMALLASVHHLIEAGARVSEETLTLLSEAACGEHPACLPLMAVLRETRLQQTLMVSQPNPARRVRM